MRRLLRLAVSEAGDFGTYIAGTIAVIVLGVTLGLGANVVHLVSGQGTLATMAQAAAKEIAVQGCLTSEDVTALQDQLQTLGWNPADLSTSAAFSATQPAGNYGSTVTVGMNYNMPIVMFGAIHAGSWLLSATGQAPMQYVQPVGTNANPVCPGTSFSGSTTPATTTYSDTLAASSGGAPLSFAQTASSPATGGSAGAAVTLTLAASPATTTVGGSVEFSGQVLDNGVPDPGASVNISGGGQATTAVTDSSGDYSAALSFTATGTFTITASAGGASAATQVTVSADGPAQVVVTAQSPVTDGTNSIIYATVTDQNGNPVADGTQVQVSSTDTADIPDQTLTTTSGQVALSVDWSQVGTWTVTFTAGTASGSADVTVNPGLPASIAMTASPNPVAAGQSTTISGTVTDASGNPVQSGTQVTLQSPTDPTDFPPETVTTASGGTFSATATFRASGTQTVTASANGVSGQVAVAVTAGAAAQFAGVTLSPNPVDAGSDLVASGTLEDASGNPVANATVTMSGAGASAATATTAANGSFSVAITPESAGNQTITLTSGAATWTGSVSVQNPPNNIAVQAWISTPGSTSQQVTAGTSLVIGATVTNNGAAMAGATVTFSESTNPATGVWTEQGQCVTNSFGNCTITITFTQAGVNVVQAQTSTASSSVEVDVVAASPYAILGYSLGATQTQAGSTITASGLVVDQFGNPTPRTDVTVTYPTRSYPNTVGTATVTVLTNSGGSFAASMELTDASSTGESVSASDGAAHASSTIIVTPGPTYYVTLSVTPSSIGAYQNPAVVAENPTGNLVNDSTMAWPVTGYFNCFYGGYDYSTSGTTPDGSTMAEIWIPPATDSPYYGGCYQPLSLSVGQPYMVSAWVDAPAGMPVQLGVDGQTTYQPSPGYAQSEVWTATGGWEHIWDWFVYSGSSFRSVAFYAYALGNNAYYTQWTDVDVVPCFVLDGSVTDLWGNPEPPGTAVDITATTGYTDTYTSTVVTDGATGTFSDAGDIAVPGWATITATSNGMSASTSIDVY